jgi:hypothetical protein
MAALDDRPRPGREPTTTDAARSWVVSLVCRTLPRVLGRPRRWAIRASIGQPGCWRVKSERMPRRPARRRGEGLETLRRGLPQVLGRMYSATRVRAGRSAERLWPDCRGATSKDVVARHRRQRSHGFAFSLSLLVSLVPFGFLARVAWHKLAAIDAVPEAVRAIAWKAQTRLCQPYRHMMTKGKPWQVVVTAIARELAGFVWSIACITSDPPVKRSAVMTASGRGLPNCGSRPRAASPAAEGYGAARRTISNKPMPCRSNAAWQDDCVSSLHTRNGTRSTIRDARRKAEPVSAILDNPIGARFPCEERGRSATHHGPAVTNPRITA